MNGPDLAVVCPSRGRPGECSRMVQSVMDTSDADVLIYFDTDDPEAPPVGSWSSRRVRVVFDRSQGRGAAINDLCDRFREYRLYALLSDDATFVRSGWDKEAAAAMDQFSNDIGVVHLAHGGNLELVNWPVLSRNWIDCVGWYNYPKLKSYCQDTIIQALGTAINRIACVSPKVISHELIWQLDTVGRISADVKEFLWFFATSEFGDALRKLERAMRSE